MPAKTTRPPQTSAQLSEPAREALDRLKRVHGVNKVVAIERGIFMLESKLLAAFPVLTKNHKTKGTK